MLRSGIIAAALFLTALPAAGGDVLTLKNGGVFEGKVSITEQGYVLDMGYVSVVFDESEVAGLTRAPLPRETYRKRAGKLEGADSSGWYELGLYAEAKGLREAAREAFEKALQADADHEGARGRLGFVRDDGQWITRDEAMSRKGYVRWGRRWVTAEEALELEIENEFKTRVKEARNLVRTLSFMITYGPARKSYEAAQKLAGVSDPAALEPLADELANRDGEVRAAVLGALGNYREDKAALAVLDVALWDNEAALRARARALLARIGNEAAFSAALRALRRGDDDTRFEASKVLGVLRDPRAIGDLIAFLSWTRPPPPTVRPSRRRGRTLESKVIGRHVRGIRAKVATNAVGYEPIIAGYRHGRLVILNDDDDGGQPANWEEFSGPGGAFVLNYDALEALRALTGRDFRFDKTAWRRWHSVNAAGFR